MFASVIWALILLMRKIFSTLQNYPYNKVLIFVVLLLAFLASARLSHADIGVGVGVGKIVVDEELSPGIIYNLPSITVINTGDEKSRYRLGIQYHEDQKEIRPKADWFIFSPAEFELEPQKVQSVSVKLNLPVNATPGDYFAYVEARPVKKTIEGSTTINVAAATKLNFTIVPGSLLSGIYHKIISSWFAFAPVPQIVLIGLVLAVSVYIAKRFINIEIKLSKRGVPKWILIGAAGIFLIVYIVFWIKFFAII